MLTLTRKVGQKIRIGDHIEIVVREIRGRQVRLGISAPQGLPVYREELYQQIAQEGGAPREGEAGEVSAEVEIEAAETDDER
jgi:carbon storage regulator